MEIEQVDLTSITRDSNTCRAIVKLKLGRHKSIDWWLKFGQAQLRNEDNLCWLTAYINNDVTDFEHDSAHALRLPLIGLKFDSVCYHSSKFTAWVDPDGEDEFRVPLPGYNPAEHPDAVKCTQCKTAHIIVPEGYYLPPFNKELYNKVRGKKVYISIGPNNE